MTRLLLINPRVPESFWSFKWAVDKMVPNKRSMNPPLGLATVAALCQEDWEVEIVDENGLVVPDANHLIEFKVEGEGILAGTDNGNPQDKTPMKSKKRNAFNGLALAVIQSTEKSGNIRLTAVSEDLKAAGLQVVSRKSNNNAKPVESLK